MRPSNQLLSTHRHASYIPESDRLFGRGENPLIGLLSWN